MAHAVQADNFPDLAELDLSPGTHQCIYWMPNGRRQCSRKHRKLDFTRAKTSGEKLISAYLAQGSPASDVRPSLVAALLEHTCCWQHGDKVHLGTDLGNELWRRWKHQMRSVVLEPLMLDTVPATPSRTGRIHSSRSVESSVNHRSSSYNTRSSRHLSRPEIPRTNEMLSNSVPEYMPMKKPGRTVTQELVRGPSIEDQHCNRDLYAFTREQSTGMLKIGYSENVLRRMDDWHKKCSYEPILRHHIKDVPYAKLIEKVTHAELLPYWRREVRCNYGAGCHVQHKEWFHVDDATAFRVMDNWAKWITVAKPYISGKLCPNWQKIIGKMKADRVAVTSQGLLDAMETADVEVAVLVNEVADVSRTRSTITQAVAEDLSEAPATTTSLVPEPNDGPGTADIVSALANILSSLTPTQTRQLRDLLDQGTRISPAVAMPPALRLVPAV